MHVVTAAAPGDLGGRLLRRSARRPGLPALARRHRLAGRDRRVPTPAWTTPGRRTSQAAQRGDLTAHVVGALWWDRERGRRAGRVAGRAARGVHPRPVPGDQRQGDAGRRRRERHGRADRAVPRPLRARHRQQRPLLRRPAGAAPLRRPARRRGLPGARARHRRPRRARGARRVRDGADPATGGTTSPTSSWSTPTTYAASASSAWPPTCRRCGPASTTRWSS